jgi:hypothetical protein
MRLLTPKLAADLVALVAKGAPLRVAGAVHGINARTIAAWQATAAEAVETPPQRPVAGALDVEVYPGQYVPAGQAYVHAVQCRDLADKVGRLEAKRVSALCAALWRKAKREPDVMKFMFKHTADLHGMREASRVAAGDEDAPAAGAPVGGDEAVVIHLPDNGRMLPTTQAAPAAAPVQVAP